MVWKEQEEGNIVVCWLMKAHCATVRYHEET
jgi:hypothetical protein